jgi:hypothetical protein
MGAHAAYPNSMRHIGFTNDDDASRLCDVQQEQISTCWVGDRHCGRSGF